jgi:hypothetical protein
MDAAGGNGDKEILKPSGWLNNAFQLGSKATWVQAT